MIYLARRHRTALPFKGAAMPPYESKNPVLLRSIDKPPAPLPPRKYEIIYINAILHLYGHLSALYGLYLCFTVAKWQTLVFASLWYVMGELGIVCGAHRLWSHRSFKVKPPLEIMLMLFNCIGFQNTATDWVRNHRLHHKHSDTDADPHNSSRGLFFSHIGWLCVKKHPDVLEKGKSIDMTDIYNNPVLRFQKKHKMPLIVGLCYVLPTVIPMFWGESAFTAWNVNLLRFVLNMNASFLVNSMAHKYGSRPYDKTISPRQSVLCTLMTLGEGFHNYHHTFPWDYRSAELGNNCINFTKWFIDFFAMIGWAYDLKTVPDEMIKKRMKRTGDGTNSWGWGDIDMTKDERDSATIFFPEKSLIAKDKDAREEEAMKLDITRIYSHDYWRLMDGF